DGPLPCIAWIGTVSAKATPALPIASLPPQACVERRKQTAMDRRSTRPPFARETQVGTYITAPTPYRDTSV
ncbi:MAG: hypothetical protein OEX13_03755, partial [Gammaproteobacteria bacterium]|nr:hypothetical protein [Gammaproteobacteria bacterium]